jgi:hypothetical protein
VKRIAFDIETEPFSRKFMDAESVRSRTRCAPRMRVACVFDVSHGSYRYFDSNERKALVRLIQSADEVVSFNGKRFDNMVLRKHCGLKGRIPLKGAHIDICEIMSARAGFRVSLDLAARLNLGENKHTDGRKMSALGLEEVKLACRSDVFQTYRLYQRFVDGILVIPPKQAWNASRQEEERSYSNVPLQCPSCDVCGSLEEIEWETDDMTDGQLAEYLAGTYGTAACRKCGDVVDWGF